MSTLSPNTFQAWLIHTLSNPAHTAPAVAIVGGWGAGKSVAQAMWIDQRWHSGDPNRPEDGLLIYPQSKTAIQIFCPDAGAYLETLGWRFEQTYNGKPNPHYVAPPGGGVRRVWLVGFYRPSTKSVAASNLEGLNVGFVCIDEAQSFAGPEVATTAWGRLRAGARPQMLLVGRPSLYQWWPEWAQSVEGESHKISSEINRENIIAWESWLKGMSPQEQDERLHCIPQAVDGAVFSDWSVKPWPEGNMAPARWQYDPGMRTYLSLDLGFRHPAVLIIARDEELGADIIVEEYNPYDISLPELAKRIQRLIDSRGYEIDEYIGDTAGNAINEHSAKSSFQILGEQLGCHFNTSYARDQKKRNIANGIRHLRDLVRNRTILTSQDMWRKSVSATGKVTLAQAMHSYSFREGSDEPKKDGKEHPIDALRYWAVTARWPNEEISNTLLSMGGLRPSRR